VLVAHGLWAIDGRAADPPGAAASPCGGGMLLWAEHSGAVQHPPGVSPASRPGGWLAPGRPPPPGAHPFAASPDVLAGVLSSLPGALPRALSAAAERELSLLLPSSPEGPLPSPELVVDPALGPARLRGRRRLARWRVPALAFGPAAALDLLTGLAEADALSGHPPAAPSYPHVTGGSLIYLAALARFAADLVARGRVLPALDRDASPGIAAPVAWRAVWRPVLSGADAQRAMELAEAMPPLCRAASEGRAGWPAGQVLAAVLEALGDAAARAMLGSAAPAGLLQARRGRPPAQVPVAERWAAALTGTDGRVPVEPGQEAQAAELAAGLAAWHRAAQAPAGPVRICFRLIEPAIGEAEAEVPTGPAARHAGAEAPSGPAARDTSAEPGASSGPAAPHHPLVGATQWRVAFALQSTGDPSLIRDAAEVWSAAADGSGWGTGGEEELLAGLGAAARLFPALERELHNATPAAVTLDTAGALAFLRETAPVLAAAGCGVMLPGWVVGARRPRLGLRLTAQTRQTAASAGGGPSRFGLRDLVDFRYDLALGDQVLDEAELAELARLKVPLVRLRGQWVELDERHLQAALAFLERRRTGTMTAGEALLAGLAGPRGPASPGAAEHAAGGADDGLDVVAVDADGWLGDLLSGEADRRLEPVGTPAGFNGELRPYQERGLAWLSFLGGLGLGGILADDMGLGKTIAILSLLAHERCDAGPAGPTLLVCPMSLVGNWQREAERFTPDLSVHVHHGTDRLRGDELGAALAGADLVITTYGLAARDRDGLAGIGWHRVVCDEAQNIKNSASRQAQAVRALPAESRVALTGTPVENRLADLWSIMEFTSPGLLGPAETFRRQFAVPIEREGDEQAAARLKRITGPFVLRRLKTDKSIISDLPEKIEMKVWCNLTPEQASLYQATVTDMLARIEAAEEGIERRGLVLATMTKLKQVCNHPAQLLRDGSRLDGRSGKLARLEEICDEIVAEGDKALCFTQYAEFGAMLRPYLAGRLGCQVLYLHGGTSKRQRDALVSEFQEGTDPAVFILSLKAGGTGLNLTAASHVIHVDRWWNPAVEDQATDRAFRIGQRRDVQVRKFVCVGTLEERIDSMIDEKRALAERIVGTGESWLAELSVDELRAAIALGPEAVSE
jgi:hypothetical protein